MMVKSRDEENHLSSARQTNGTREKQSVGKWIGQDSLCINAVQNNQKSNELSPSLENKVKAVLRNPSQMKPSSLTYKVVKWTSKTSTNKSWQLKDGLKRVREEYDNVLPT